MRSRRTRSAATADDVSRIEEALPLAGPLFMRFRPLPYGKFEPGPLSFVYVMLKCSALQLL
jgi:hypothetical protein